MRRRTRITVALLLLGGPVARAQTVIDQSGGALLPAELAMVLRNLGTESRDPAGMRLRHLRRRAGPPVVLCGEISTRDDLGVPTEFRTFAAVPDQDMVFSPFDVAGGPFPMFDSLIRAHCGTP
ncbi:hypothetical protein [Methylobacterium sp. JK268]